MRRKERGKGEGRKDEVKEVMEEVCGQRKNEGKDCRVNSVDREINMCDRGKRSPMESQGNGQRKGEEVNEARERSERKRSNEWIRNGKEAERGDEMNER